MTDTTRIPDGPVDAVADDDGVPVGHPTSDDLKRELRTLAKALAVLAEERRSLVSRQTAIQAELGRRKADEEARTYAERRRSAAAAGASPPRPPIGTAVSTAPRAAAARLASMTISSGRAPSPVEDQREALGRHDDDVDPEDVAVTDHAVVRYMERVMGFDFSPIRERILRPVVRAALAAGVTRIRLEEGYVIAREGVVTTFLPADAAPGKRRRDGPHNQQRAARSRDVRYAVGEYVSEGVPDGEMRATED